MEAVLLLYSGRPNPHWQVPPEDVAEIRRAIREMPAAAVAGEPPGLGYAGVQVRFIDEQGRPREWLFANGLAESEGEWFVDERRRIERLLLVSGRGKVPEIDRLGLIGGAA